MYCGILYGLFTGVAFVLTLELAYSKMGVFLVYDILIVVLLLVQSRCLQFLSLIPDNHYSVLWSCNFVLWRLHLSVIMQNECFETNYFPYACYFGGSLHLFIVCISSLFS